MKKQPKQRNLLPLVAAVVIIAAVAVTLMPQLPKGKNTETPQTQALQSTPSTGAGDLLIQADKIGTEASYFDYDAGGTTVQVFAVQASDGTIRLALNTCQVCNGSPYAYFTQDGNWFICQNCGNRFASTQIGIASGGCRPVPITEDIYAEQDGIITVPAFFLEENAALFQNWKNF